MELICHGFGMVTGILIVLLGEGERGRNSHNLGGLTREVIIIRKSPLERGWQTYEEYEN